MSHMQSADITIVGAGVIGLAIAQELCGITDNIFVLERNNGFGQETSSRNSEVIHAGIYYPEGSLKAVTCIEGRDLLYAYCTKNNIPHRKTGKLIVATAKEELDALEGLRNNGRANGVSDLQMLGRKEALHLEPGIDCLAALYSPSTGIVDSHSLMKCLEQSCKAQGGQFAYRTELAGVKKSSDGFELSVRDADGGHFSFCSRILVNSAGLHADKVAVMAGIQEQDYRIKYCKGDYFRVSQSKSRRISRLVYPVPVKYGAGLGIHATLDLAGSLRLGPDDEYIDTIDYSVNPAKQKQFFESVCKFLPFIEMGDVQPDMAGVRPKLQGPGETFRDYIIKDEKGRGLTGFINLIGIESPGLTSSLSIARRVRELIEPCL